MTKRHMGGTVISAVALLAAGTQSIAARAQAVANSPTPEAEVAPEDIVVTARLRNERLRDIPVAATAIDAQSIADQGGLRGQKDIASNTPSVHFLDTSAPITSEVSIRGSSTSRGTAADTTVGLYRDGMFVPGGSQGGRSFTPMDIFDVQRIEVLRGPQGGLYGRNAVGGAINVITNKPTQDLGGSGSVSFGTYHRFEAELIVNVPASEKLSFRFGAAGTDQQRGAVYNTTRKEYIDSEQYAGAKAQVRFTPSERTTINFSTDYFKWEAPPLLLVYVQEAGTTPTQPIAKFPNGVRQDRRRIDRNGYDDGDQTLLTTLLTIEHDFGPAILTSITSYRDRYNTNNFDTDLIDPALRETLRLAGADILNSNPNTQTTNATITHRVTEELRLTGGSGRFKWLFGGDYTYLTDDRVGLDERLPAPLPRAASLANPPSFLRTSHSTNTSYSVYGSASYDITTRLGVTVEGRYTNDQKDIDTTYLNTQTNAIIPAQTFKIRSGSQDVAYTAAANYKLTPDWLGYVRVGTAFRPGGFNPNLGVVNAPNPVVPSFGSEDSIEYEVGTKVKLSRAIYLTATGYIGFTDNALVSQMDGCQLGVAPCFTAPITFQANGGRSRVYGGELELSTRSSLFGGMFRFNGGVSHQRGKFLNGQYNQLELARVPHWLLNGDFNYRHDLTMTVDGFINVKINATVDGVQDVGTVPLYKLSDYTIVDGRAGVARRGAWELAVYARNIFDQQPVVFKQISVERYLQPRTFGIELSRKF